MVEIMREHQLKKRRNINIWYRGLSTSVVVIQTQKRSNKKTLNTLHQPHSCRPHSRKVSRD